LARLLRLIVPIACFLIFQGAYAIDFHFSASNGGESVGMTDSYDVDDSVGVWSRSSASFDGVSMTDRKSLSGSGDANINHVMCGRGGGSDYVINYALETLGASCIDGSGSSTLTPGAGVASRSVSTTGSAWTTSELSGTQGGDFAGVESYARLADISASQSVSTGGSVAASQKVEAQGAYAAAYGQGKDSEGSYAVSYADVWDGYLEASQGIKTGNYATGGCVAASQKVEAQGDPAMVFGEGRDSRGNYAFIGATAYDGTTLDASQGVKVGNSATGGTVAASQNVEAQGGSATAYGQGMDAEGSYVNLHADLYNGSIEASQQVKAATGGSVAASQNVEAQGESATAYGQGVDSKGSYVEDYAAVSYGSLDASQQVKAGNSATARQSAVIDGSGAYAYCEARNPDKNYYAYVDDWINGNAYFEFEGEASVDDSEARAHQRSYAEGNFIWPWAYSTGTFEERFWFGTKSFESWAWTTDTDDDAIIVEL